MAPSCVVPYHDLSCRVLCLCGSGFRLSAVPEDQGLFRTKNMNDEEVQAMIQKEQVWCCSPPATPGGLHLSVPLPRLPPVMYPFLPLPPLGTPCTVVHPEVRPCGLCACTAPVGSVPNFSHAHFPPLPCPVPKP